MFRKSLFLVWVFGLQASWLGASSDEGDILERRDVQSILFGNGSYGQSAFANSSPVFRGEFIGANASVTASAYYLKRINTYVKSQWGAGYREDWNRQHIVDLKGAVFLSWERYFIQPYGGVDAGFNVYPQKERNLFSHLILGADIQVARNFGISARQNWGFPSYSFHLMQPFYFKMENAMVEIALFWQI